MSNAEPKIVPGMMIISRGDKITVEGIIMCVGAYKLGDYVTLTMLHLIRGKELHSRTSSATHGICLTKRTKAGCCNQNDT
jgi:hypothetical protein